MLAGLVACLAVAPLVQLVVRVAAGDGTRIAAVIFRPRTLDLMTTTLGITVAVCAGCLVLGIATAWVLASTDLVGRPLWTIVACLPLAIPSYVSAFAWTTLAPGLNGPGALTLVLIVGTMPYVTVPTMAAFARADTAVVDAARTLGRSPMRAFVSVTLPQVMPAALAGTLLVALYTLADFGAPAILRVDTLTTGIYALFTGGLDRSVSAAMALILAALALLCVVGEGAVRRSARVASAAVHHRSTPVRLQRRSQVVATTALLAVATIGIVVPLAALVHRLIGAERYGSTPGDLVAATLTTVVIASVAAAIAVVAALPIGVLAARHRGRVVAVIEALTYVGHAIPGLVVALALVALSLTMFPGAYQTPLLLLGAYVVLFLPKAVGSTRTAVASVPRSLEDVSRTLGRGRAATWLRVVLPGAAPGLVAGGVLVMASVMRELSATLMLRPIGIDTLATELWSKTAIGAYGAAAGPALLLVAVGLVPAWAMARSIRYPRTASAQHVAARDHLLRRRRFR